LNAKIELLKKLFDNSFSWLVVTSRFNAITINVFASVDEEACVVPIGDELEENMHMILLLLKTRVGVGKGGEPTQFNKIGLVALTCVWVFVVWWNAFIQDEETSCKKQGTHV
jgi:hypothetical protein